jgi:hypothetical protein
MLTKAEAERLAEKEIQRGRMVEAGWILTGVRTAPDNASEIALDFGRKAYFTGADFVLQIIRTALLEAKMDLCDVADMLETMNKELETNAKNWALFTGVCENERPH